MVEFTIKKAEQNDTAQLTSIAFSSKAYWGYDASFMESCQEELTLKEQVILHQPCYLAVVKSKIVGFYLLQELSTNQVEMEMLFVHPDYIGKGIGKKLFLHAISKAKEMGYKEMEIQADPYAQAFYERMGAVVVSQTPSQSIPNRFLPQMELKF